MRGDTITEAATRRPAGRTAHLRWLMLTAAGVLALAACGSTSMTVAGQEVTDTTSTLTAVQTAWRAGLQGTNVTVAKDARCYVPVADEGTEVSAAAFCGPVRHFGISGLWDTTSLDAARISADKVALRASANPSFSTGRDVPAGFHLVTPDGKRPGKNPTLAEPAPPAAQAGTVVTQDGTLSVRDATKPDPAKAVLRTPDFELTALQVGTVAEVGQGAERLSAPAGQTFRAVTVQLDAPTMTDPAVAPGSSPAAEPYTTSDKVTALFQAESSTSEMNLRELQPGRAVTYVVAVPTDASDPALQVTYDGATQSLSLKTGERTGDVVAAYYGPGGGSASIANGTYSEHKDAGDLHMTWSLTVGQAQQGPYIGSSSVGWAPEDKTWVVVPLDDYTCSALYWDVTTAPGAVTLTGKDGTTYRPVIDETQGKDAWEEDISVRFAVPAGETSFTLKIAPHGTFHIASGFANKPTSGTFTLPARTWNVQFGAS